MSPARAIVPVSAMQKATAPSSPARLACRAYKATRAINNNGKVMAYAALKKRYAGSAMVATRSLGSKYRNRPTWLRANSPPATTAIGPACLLSGESNMSILLVGVRLFGKTCGPAGDDVPESQISSGLGEVSSPRGGSPWVNSGASAALGGAATGLLGGKGHRFHSEQVEAEVPYAVQQSVELALVEGLGQEAGVAVSGLYRHPCKRGAEPFAEAP